jgi:hypothetical protein
MFAVGCNPIFGIHEGKPRPICADPSGNLIDDMEDGDGFICEMSGRKGHWYVVGDPTSTMLGPGDGTSLEPSLIDDQESGTSRYAARFTGSGFTGWGALMGFNLNVQDVAFQPYNAVAVGGIKFRMKSKSNTPVSVDFPIPDTTERRYGGQCEDSASASNCDNDFSFKIAAPTPDWTEYEVPFLALTQDGGSANWDPHVLIGIKFRVPPGAPFDVWVDDVRFYPCSTAGCRHPRRRLGQRPEQRLGGRITRNDRSLGRQSVDQRFQRHDLRSLQRLGHGPRRRLGRRNGDHSPLGWVPVVSSLAARAQLVVAWPTVASLSARTRCSLGCDDAKNGAFGSFGNRKVA